MVQPSMAGRGTKPRWISRTQVVFHSKGNYTCTSCQICTGIKQILYIDASGADRIMMIEGIPLGSRQGCSQGLVALLAFTDHGSLSKSATEVENCAGEQV